VQLPRATKISLSVLTQAGLCLVLLLHRNVTTGVLQGVFVFSVVKYEPLVYMNYRYPAWGQGIGWMMALSSIIVIPGYAIYLFIVTPGNVRQVTYSVVVVAVVVAIVVVVVRANYTSLLNCAII